MRGMTEGLSRLGSGRDKIRRLNPAPCVLAKSSPAVFFRQPAEAVCLRRPKVLRGEAKTPI